MATAALHPSKHLWPALQRRFADQNKPSTAPDRLLRGFCVVPLEGQEETAIWSLGFKEVSSALRTASLSRDFVGVANLVDPEVPCYLVVYIGDVQDPVKSASATASSLEVPRDWVLISYVPSKCTSFEAKKMADNRAGLKAGLGGERFAEGGMWCVSPEQISLSSYMRSTSEAGVAIASAAGSEASAVAMPDVSDSSVPKVEFAPVPPAALMGVPASGGAMGALPPSALAVVPGGAAGEDIDATEVIWEERIKGVRHAYADSCSRLVGALEELEETLCALTGDPYRPDEPILRARTHMAKNLEAMRLTG